MKSSNNRIEQLDSIRGLAALIVFIHHTNLVTKKSLLPALVTHSPLKVLISGHASVILFFVLSGFVLYLPFAGGQSILYRHFILKRILRIYVPYLVAISSAMALSTLLSRGPIKTLSAWFNRTWTTPLNPKLFWEHITLLGNIHSSHFDNVIWSLVHEMRISLIFSLIAWFVLRGRWWMMALTCAVLSFAGGLNDVMNFQISNGFHTTYFDSLHFTSMFIFGALLAKHKDRLADLFRRIPLLLRWLVPVAAFWLYIYPDVVTHALGMKPTAFGRIVEDLLIAIGAGLFILTAIGSTVSARLLQLRPLVFLGKISYSLYLYHLIVLLSMLHLFYQRIPLLQVYALAFVTAIPVSALSYYFIEQPAIRLGKYWTRRKTTIAVEYTSPSS